MGPTSSFGNGFDFMTTIFPFIFILIFLFIAGTIVQSCATLPQFQLPARKSLRTDYIETYGC